MSTYRPGEIAEGAKFVNDFGMGAAERTLVPPDFQDMKLDEIQAKVALADVVALAELLVEQLGVATGKHERQILFDLEDYVEDFST